MEKNLIHHFRYIQTGATFHIEGSKEKGNKKTVSDNNGLVEIDSKGKKQNVYHLGKSNCTADCRGGVTVAGIISKDKETIRWGISKCDRRDNFNRQKGKLRAESRAKNSKDAIITPNIEYDVAKKLTEIFANTLYSELLKLNVQAYIDAIIKDPEANLNGVIFLK